MSSLLERVDQTTIYVQPIHFTLSMITNILNICVLHDRKLRSSPCTYYFLVFSIVSIFYTCLLCPIQILRRYNILWVNTPVGCRLQPYLLFVLPFLANLMLILASFDRFCSSSMSVKLRSLSNMKTTRRTIVFSIFLSIIYMLPMLIIYYWEFTLNMCLQYSSTPITVYIFSQIIIYYILIPLIMIIFGLLTILNIRQQLTRIRPIVGNNPNRRTEGQLARMLSLQVGVHLIIALPFGIIYLINSFIPSTRTTFILGIRLAFVAWQQCDYFIPFFLYTLSSSIYREKLFRILKLKHSTENITQTNTQIQTNTTRHFQPVGTKTIPSTRITHNTRV